MSTQGGSAILAIITRGFADGIHNPETRRRNELSWECQSKLTNRVSSTMNDEDLALARECYVDQSIQREMGGRIPIKWVTEKPVDLEDGKGEGPDLRKVEVVINTAVEGGC